MNCIAVLLREVVSAQREQTRHAEEAATHARHSHQTLLRIEVLLEKQADSAQGIHGLIRSIERDSRHSRAAPVAPNITPIYLPPPPPVTAPVEKPPVAVSRANNRSFSRDTRSQDRDFIPAVSCLACKGAHWTVDCTRSSKNVVSLALAESQRCFRCGTGNDRHNDNTCRNVKCKQCKGNHPTYLCRRE